MKNEDKKTFFIAAIGSKRKKNQPETSNWRQFVMSITKPEHMVFGFSKEELRFKNKIFRDPSKHIYKTTKDTTIVNTQDPNRSHQYTSEQKELLSEVRSMSIIAPEQGFSPPVFGEDFEKRRGEKGELVGVIFSTDNPENTKNLLISRIFWRNAGTAYRMDSTTTIPEMRKYIEENMDPSINQLIQRNYTGDNNEVMTRVRWDQNGKIGIFMDNLKSRIIGQLRAIDLASITNKSVDKVFYNKMLKSSSQIYEYSQEEQDIDLQKGLVSKEIDVKAMSLMITCLKDQSQCNELEKKLDSTELKKQFLYLLTNGYISYFTENKILENLLNIKLSELPPKERKDFMLNLNEKLISNLDQLTNHNLKEFMLICKEEVIRDMSYKLDGMDKRLSNMETLFSSRKNHYDLRQKSTSLVESFKEAIKYHDYNTAMLLLNNQETAKTILEYKDNDDSTIMHYITKLGEDNQAVINIMEKLISIGAQIDLQNIRGNTPLFSAALYDKLELVDYLLQQNANVLLKNKEGVSVLQIIQEEIPESKLIALRQVEDLPTSPLSSSGSFTSEAISEQDNFVSMEDLSKITEIKQQLSALEDIGNTRESFKETANKEEEKAFFNLFLEASKKSSVSQELILAQYPKFKDSVDKNGNTIIHVAISCCDNEFLSKLLEDSKQNNILDVNKPNRFGNAPLLSTLNRCDVERTRTLLEHGADLYTFFYKGNQIKIDDHIQQLKQQDPSKDYTKIEKLLIEVRSQTIQKISHSGLSDYHSKRKSMGT